jgi:platelet-activating factor acetylhydrolase
MLWALGSSTVIPGTVDAPLLSTEGHILVDESGGVTGLGKIFELAMGKEKEMKQEVGLVDDRAEETKGTLPCVVFTHGMAGMSQSYSHYLGSIASRGFVVAAVEHRDGSGPGSIIHFPDGKERTVWHLKAQDFVYVNLPLYPLLHPFLESCGLTQRRQEPPLSPADLQVAQLAFREAEISETIRFFKLLNAGDDNVTQNLKPDSPETTLPGFKNRLNMSAVTVIGHSYGATGALQALKGAPSEKMPINGAIMLDPGKGSGRLNKDIDLPILVFHSGEWTEKQTEFYGLGKHFDVVKKLVQSVKTGWFMTLSKSKHESNAHYSS